MFPILMLFFWPQGNSGWHSSRLVLLATEETAARQRGSCQHELRGQIVVQVGGRPNRCWCGAWGRLRHSSEVAPHHRHTPTTTKGAGLPAMWTQEKVCELLPRPVQSIIQQMEHINHSEGRADWAGSSRVGGGGRWTPHTDFLCARGRALQYYSDLGGVRVGGGVKWVEPNRSDWPEYWFVHTLKCLNIQSVTCLSDSAQWLHIHDFKKLFCNHFFFLYANVIFCWRKSFGISLPWQ